MAQNVKANRHERFAVVVSIVNWNARDVFIGMSVETQDMYVIFGIEKLVQCLWQEFLSLTVRPPYQCFHTPPLYINISSFFMLLGTSLYC